MWSANLRSNFYLEAKSAKIYLAIGVPILMKLKTKSTWVILKLSSRMNKKFIKLSLRFLAKITGNVTGREFHVKEPLKSALQLLHSEVAHFLGSKTNKIIQRHLLWI